MSSVLTWCAKQDIFSRGESPTTRAVRRAVAEDNTILLSMIEKEYVAFRLHHAHAGTVDTPEGFGQRFREWMDFVLRAERMAG